MFLIEIQKKKYSHVYTLKKNVKTSPPLDLALITMLIYVYLISTRHHLISEKEKKSTDALPIDAAVYRNEYTTHLPIVSIYNSLL